MDIKDIPSFIQSFVLVMAGLFTLVHYTFKLSSKNTKFERVIEGMRLLPSFAAISIITVMLFVITPIVSGTIFTPPAIILLVINIIFIFLGMVLWSFTRKIKAKWISVLIFLLFVFSVSIDLMISKLYFQQINLFTILYELFAIMYLFIPAILSVQNWMFSDIKKSKMIFILHDEEFEAEVLSETARGDYLVRKTNDPLYEYWVNRDQIKMIKIPTPRSGI